MEGNLQKSDRTPGITKSAASYSAVDEMCQLLKENRAGRSRGIYSVCSANHLVLEAAFAQAKQDDSPLLIEATCNQVNQHGGYTGQTPAQFRDYVHTIARQNDFPTERLILGGDHLGPNPWRFRAAEVAMEEACEMVAAYAAAGFNKLHLDASMRCGDDPQVLANEEIAERAARLCEVAEASAPAASTKPVYVIGTEVPTPGGAQGEMEVELTSIAALKETLNVHYHAFSRRNLSSAWERIVGVVVQPGVEFGNETIADYVPARARELTQSVLQWKEILFEAHSTDYQTAESLRQLVNGHFGILKVGPELTFVMREAVFGLARIEEEWIAGERCSGIRDVIERVMIEHPENWKAYYHGNESQMRFARAYSLSDRIRYYWPNVEISDALSLLIENLQESPAPLPLIAQYLPRQAEAIRTGEISNDPIAIIHNKIRKSLARYSEACGFVPGG
jgi:D-tagatose-1,6-bisphosphate aldolase subunit GatZ/KbaZ